MKKCLLFISITFIASLSIASTDPYFQLSQPSVELIEEETLSYVSLPEEDNFSRCLSESADDSNREIDFDMLINVGEKIWEIVKAGEPTLDFKTKSASAIPAQAQCLFALTSWKAPRSATYKVSYKNGFGMEVISMTYKLIYTYGGRFDGVGQYLSQVSIHPAQVQVSWGFDFDASVDVQQILNVGSSESPEAGMQISLEWSVGSVVNKHQASEIYFVQGSGAMERL